MEEKLFIYEINTGNVVEERPIPNAEDSDVLEGELEVYNQNNPENQRSTWVASEFPPKHYKYDTELKTVVIDPPKTQTKLFVFSENTGSLIEERFSYEMLLVQEEIIEHNTNNPTDRKNMYSGESFPPYGYKYDGSKKEFVRKTTQEKIDSGELTLQPDQKIVNGEIVGKTLYEQHEEGILQLEDDQEIDELDPNRIVKMSLMKRYEKKLEEPIVLFNEFVNRLNMEFHKKMEPIINYDSFEIQGWKEKKELSLGWLDLADSDKLSEKNKVLYRVLIIESGATDDLSDAEKIIKVDGRAKKILEKAEYYELRYSSFLKTKDDARGELKTLYEKFITEEDRTNHWSQMQSVLDNLSWEY